MRIEGLKNGWELLKERRNKTLIGPCIFFFNVSRNHSNSDAVGNYGEKHALISI